MKTLTNVLNCWRISNSWLIISSLIAIVALSSCTPSVVRTSNAYKVKPHKSAVQEAQSKQNAEDKIREFEEKLAKNESNQLDLADAEEAAPKAPVVSSTYNPERRLPTLREQMQVISDEQVVIKNKVNTLQNDVVEIKYVLEEIKIALANSGNLTKKEVVTGTPRNEVIEEESYVAPKSSNNVLLPDETVKKPKASPAPKAETKPITAPAKAPKKEEPKVITAAPAIVQPVVEEPSKPKTSLVEALNDMSRKDYNGSINKLNDVLLTTKDAETQSEANYWLAENHMALNNFDQAIQYYNQVLKNAKTDKQDDASSKIAECLLKTGQTNEALAAFKKLITKYPKSEFVPKARKMLQQF